MTRPGGSALAKNSNCGRAYPGPLLQDRALGTCVNPRNARASGRRCEVNGRGAYGRPLVAVEERTFGSWTIARLRSVRQGEREERGKSCRREIQVLATCGIVHFEYGDGPQVYLLLFGRRQQAVHNEATHGPRCDLTLRELNSMPLIVGGHPGFRRAHLSGSRSIRDCPDLRFARAGRFAALRLSSEVMFGDGFEQSTILRTGPDSGFSGHSSSSRARRTTALSRAASPESGNRAFSCRAGARSRAQPKALGTVAKSVTVFLRSTADRCAVEPAESRRTRVSLSVSAEESKRRLRCVVRATW